MYFAAGIDFRGKVYYIGIKIITGVFIMLGVVTLILLSPWIVLFFSGAYILFVNDMQVGALLAFAMGIGFSFVVALAFTKKKLESDLDKLLNKINGK